MPMITVKLYATFREVAGTASCSIEAERLDELLRSMMKEFGPPFAKVLDATEGIVVLLNGRNVDTRGSIHLSEGDEIAIFPPVSGG